MTLGDKIAYQRKKNHWSQEELAEKINVSRQAVSKWESGQSLPDLDNILLLSSLFGVTTDYLLKNEESLPTDESTPDSSSESADSPLRKVTLAEATEFLELRKNAAPKIAFATFLCILSPICLLILGAICEKFPSVLSENAAAGIGLTVLFLFVATAVAVFLNCGFKSAPYEFLEKQPFTTEYNVKETVRQVQNAYRSTYIRCNIIGACLCILAPVSLFGGLLFSEEVLFMVTMLSVLLLIVGIGVIFFVWGGVRWASMQKLLKEGDYSEEEKHKSRILGTVSGVYWPLVTAIYLVWLFTADNYHWNSNLSWIVWPVAGVVYAAIAVLCKLLTETKRNR